MATSDFWISLERTAKTVAINTASSGDNTLHTVTAGRRFAVFHVWIEAEGAVDVLFKSGSTAITGPMAFGANDEKEWKNSGVPVFVGRLAGENFVLNLGGAVQANGFAVVAEMTV